MADTPRRKSKARAKPAKGRAADPYAVRAGELRARLPGRFNASVYFIGRIRTPRKEGKDCTKNHRESEGGCTI